MKPTGILCSLEKFIKEHLSSLHKHLFISLELFCRHIVKKSHYFLKREFLKKKRTKELKKERKKKKHQVKDFITNK